MSELLSRKKLFKLVRKSLKQANPETLASVAQLVGIECGPPHTVTSKKSGKEKVRFTVSD